MRLSSASDNVTTPALSNKVHASTPLRKCVRRHPRMPSSVAIAFVDDINSGNYAQASQFLPYLSGYQPASELNKICSDTPSFLFSSHEQWNRVDTGHINKETYGRMALFLIIKQAEKLYAHYNTVLMSEPNKRLGTTEQ